MEEQFEEILKRHYHEKKKLWGIAPVDAKYKSVVIDAMKEVWNLAIEKAEKSADKAIENSKEEVYIGVANEVKESIEKLKI